ncbi:hypothetical protein EDD21DRAFT_419392 [Dissophora ornata]|nr:hypothetical protein BGZ58_005678 [Dissophora ornata]KAI8596722.1 hypothetical protein EDD21DRAFT_419392 [Dissophora ornata]
MSLCVNPAVIIIIIFSLGCGIGSLIAILVEHHGCGDPFFDNTRARCLVQYGVGACEILWSIVLVTATCVLVQRTVGRKSTNQVVVESVLGSARDQANLSPRAEEENRGQIMNANDTAVSGAVELTVVSNHTSTTEQDGGENEEEEQLPMYTQTQPSGQPPIVDAAHPPERSADAVVRVPNSEAAEADPVATLASPPHTEQHAESTVVNMAAEVLPPLPSYRL